MQDSAAAADAGTTSETLIECSSLNPFLGRHSLRTTDCSSPCNNELLEQIQVGCLYEINRRNLPPRSPIHLKAIRAVMVTEKTEYNVAVRFPSSLSLRTYFRRRVSPNDQTNNQEEEKKKKNQTVNVHPKFDEQFVMGSKLAKELLVRQILPSEVSKQKDLRSFWLQEPSSESNEATSISTTSSTMDKLEGTVGCDSSVKGMCLSELNSPGLVRWGVRRRVTFVGRQKELKKNPEPGVGQSSLTPPVKAENEANQEGRRGILLEQEVNGRRMRTRKRTREISMHSRKKAKATTQHEKKEKRRRIEKKKKVISVGGVKKNKEKLSYDRWSKERYKKAEGKMLEILKESRAVFGKPILRRNLRMEARKHIGDTGLLDHLLKHMAGKISPNGEDRFRRRHNAEGEMEYWLEKADLVNVRREAGVKDPYWTPPPGWQPGDNPSQDPICARDFKLLKDEMADLKRNMQELVVFNKSSNKEAAAAGIIGEDQDNVTDQQQQPAALMSSSSNNLSPSKAAAAAVVVAPLKEMYENLVKRKAQLEQQLAEISNSLNSMEDEVGKITSRKVVMEETTKSSVLVEAAAEGIADKEEEMRGSLVLKREYDHHQEVEEEIKERVGAAAAFDEAAAEKAAKRQRLRSGFRICKPQGTFLWPNMVGGGGSTTGASTTSTAVAGCSNNSILSLSPHGSCGLGHGNGHHQHHQVVVQVHEDLNMVPTPSSVNSSSSTISHLQLLTSAAAGGGGEGGPRSPVMRPLAERRAVTVTVMVPELTRSTAYNESGDNNNNNNISTTTTTSCLHHHHHHQNGHGPHGPHHDGHGSSTINNSTSSRKREFVGTTSTPTSSSSSAHQASVLPVPPSYQLQQLWGRRGEKQLAAQSEATTTGTRSSEMIQYQRQQQQLQKHIEMGLGMGLYGQGYVNGPPSSLSL